jgi:hypothetical protein
MCNNRVKIKISRWLKNLKNIVQNVYQNSYYLNSKQMSIAEIHLRFHGYDPVSPVVAYVTMDG